MYVPLYVKSNYTLLSSLIKIDGYISLAKDLGMKSLVLTDNNMYGAMEFYQKCKKNQIKPILGLEILMDKDPLLLYAKNEMGYQTLIKLATIQTERAIQLSDLESFHDEVVALVPRGNISLFQKVTPYFPECYLGYTNKIEERELASVTENLVFCNEVLYLQESHRDYLKYVRMIRDGKTIADTTDEGLFETKEVHHLLTDDIYDYTENTHLFTTQRIADACNLEFSKPELLLPIFETENSLSSHEYLVQLSRRGLQKRCHNQVTEEYLNRLQYELSVIEKMGFSNYFLVVYDFIKYAKKEGMLVGPGRGSAAGSLVAYCLGITDIDPIHYQLFFERFLNPERVTMPDIDTDFPDVYRDQVIHYVTEKYGTKNVSGIITFGTLAAKQALRDVSRVLNVPLYQVDLVTKKIPSVTKQKLPDFYERDPQFRSMIDADKKLQLVYKIASFIEGFPRHTSSHAAGIVMCKKPLDEVLPLKKDGEMYLTEYSMEYLEDLGLLKMDFLGLKNLTTIMRVIEDIERGEQTRIDFATIPLDDPKALHLFTVADTTGIFQFESDGMKNFLRKLKPTSFEDIFAAIALFRPGPAVNIDSYIRRKQGLEPIEYLHPSLEPILKSTYGIIVYQEQIMQIANVLAGYSLGEADILRRAMSKKKYDILKNEEKKFIRQAIERGYSEEIAHKVYDLIMNFANYGFNRAHSVAYSVIAYKMAYLKSHYPKYFYSNLLSSVIGSETKTKEYIFEMKSRGLKVQKPDINSSTDQYRAEVEGIRFPLSNIRSVGSVSCGEILKARGDHPFIDIFDFVSRTSNRSITRKTIESLIDAGCFASFGYNQATLQKNLDSIMNYADLTKDLEASFVLKPELEIVSEYSKDVLIAKEKELFGVYLSNHPVTNYFGKFPKVVPLKDLPNYFNRVVETLVLVDYTRTIDTKTGQRMMFLVGSDEYTQMDYTLFPKTLQQYPNLRAGMILHIVGRVEKRYDKYQIIVNTIETLGEEQHGDH